jgi:hypothetical protein
MKDFCGIIDVAGSETDTLDKECMRECKYIYPNLMVV